MSVDEIKSERIRRKITGSCCPAQEIMDLPNLTEQELAEANRYFSYAGGLPTAAGLERNHARSLDA